MFIFFLADEEARQSNLPMFTKAVSKGEEKESRVLCPMLGCFIMDQPFKAIRSSYGATGSIDIRFSGRPSTICLIRPLADFLLFFNPCFHSNRYESFLCHCIIFFFFPRKIVVSVWDNANMDCRWNSAQYDFRVPISVINHLSCTFWVYDFDKIPSFELWPCIQH